MIHLMIHFQAYAFPTTSNTPKPTRISFVIRKRHTYQKFKMNE